MPPLGGAIPYSDATPHVGQAGSVYDAPPHRVLSMLPLQDQQRMAAQYLGTNNAYRVQYALSVARQDPLLAGNILMHSHVPGASGSTPAPASQTMPVSADAMSARSGSVGAGAGTTPPVYPAPVPTQGPASSLPPELPISPKETSFDVDDFIIPPPIMPARVAAQRNVGGTAQDIARSIDEADAAASRSDVERFLHEGEYIDAEGRVVVGSPQQGDIYEGQVTRYGLPSPDLPQPDIGLSTNVTGAQVPRSVGSAGPRQSPIPAGSDTQQLERLSGPNATEQRILDSVDAADQGTEQVTRRTLDEAFRSAAPPSASQLAGSGNENATLPRVINNRIAMPNGSMIDMNPNDIIMLSEPNLSGSAYRLHVPTRFVFDPSGYPVVDEAALSAVDAFLKQQGRNLRAMRGVVRAIP